MKTSWIVLPALLLAGCGGDAPAKPQPDPLDPDDIDQIIGEVLAEESLPAAKPGKAPDLSEEEREAVEQEMEAVEHRQPDKGGRK